MVDVSSLQCEKVSEHEEEGCDTFNEASCL